MRDFTRPSRGWSALCRVLLLAAIGMAALSAASCRTQRVEERVTIRADTLRAASIESVTLETAMQGIPADSVSLTIPMEVMQILPEGAEFSRKQGRTRVSLRRQGAAVVAEAVTDSMAREVRRYERRARDSLEQRVAGAQQSVAIKSPAAHAPGSTAARRLRLIGLAVLATVALLLFVKVRTLFK